jgi:hypothetical protein
VDVTTHLRGRLAQAGALLAVVACGIAVAPAVALASPPDVEITSLPTDVLASGSLTMKYTVTYKPDDPTDTGSVNANIKVSGMACSGNCSQITQVDAAGTSFTASLTAPAVDAGTTKTVTVQISVTIKGESNSTSQAITVQGPDKPQTVTQISGKVKDQDGKALSGAAVAMQDSANRKYNATTNGSGGYSFIASDANPIAPGSITVGAVKDGYDGATVTVQAAAGRSVTVPLILKAAASTTTAPSASASVSAPASAEAIDPATDAPTTDAPTTESTTDTTKASEDSGSGSLLFIVLGGLLVAAGIGAIVLVFMRRKSATEDEPEGDDPTSIGSGSGGAVPPIQGRFNDATRVASPMAAPAAPTMVTPRAGGGTLGDAPTMVQQVEDEFPDPYGAPVPHQGGYQAPGAGGWDNQAGGYGGGSGYAEPNQYGAAPQDNGYGAGAGAGAYGAGGYAQGGGYGGGQGEQQRYDEPTGMYRPEADGYGGYDQGGYGAAQGNQYGGGYDQGQGGGYEQGGYDQGGYGQGGGTYGGGQGGGYEAGGQGGAYGAPAQQQYGAPQGGYDQGGTYGGAQGGYDQGQAGAYGQGGYEQPAGGYDPGQGGGYEQGGYDQGGYGQGGGTYGGQQQAGHRGGQFRQEEPSHPGQRRSDWTDN